MEALLSVVEDHDKTESRTLKAESAEDWICHYPRKVHWQEFCFVEDYVQRGSQGDCAYTVGKRPHTRL
jgi:hypothetical protein